jgi:hypothetical protein
MSNKIQVFSSGGGTQSAAIAALIIQGRLPKPDFVVIADTGRERQTTWDYLDSVIRPGLKKVGLEVHRIGPEWQSIPAHGKNWKSHNNATIILPGYTSQTGSTGKFSGFCSARWKQETRDRYLSKQLGLTRSMFRSWIGFSVDEPRRYLRMMNGEEYKKGQLWFPLVEGVRLRRFESIDVVKKMGWPEPPRSACYMCPNQGDDEWIDLKANSPQEFQMAVELERQVRQEDRFFWFHPSCVPLDQVDFTKPTESSQIELFNRRECSSGVCFV